MTFVITQPCIGVKSGECVDVCPVDCIHPTKTEAGFAAADMLHIDPEVCIDCGACATVCPVEAIFAGNDVPEKWASFIAMNAELAKKGGAAITEGEAPPAPIPAKPAAAALSAPVAAKPATAATPAAPPAAAAATPNAPPAKAPTAPKPEAAERPAAPAAPSPPMVAKPPAATAPIAAPPGKGAAEKVEPKPRAPTGGAPHEAHSVEEARKALDAAALQFARAVLDEREEGE